MERHAVLDWFGQALAAVDPRALTSRHLVGGSPGATVIALGKAAIAMCWGAEDAVGPIEGVCVTDTVSEAPAGIELIIGDHPIPGPASFDAGREVLERAAGVPGPWLALVSGGGSSLCERLLDGVDPGFFVQVSRALLDGGASIEEVNLVRGHLSAIKAGGLARATGRPVKTLVLSDVSGHGPELVASGPTLSAGRDPDRVVRVLESHGIIVPSAVDHAMRSVDPRPITGPVTVIGDGRTAARALVEAAASQGVAARLYPEWLTGSVESCLDRFLDGSTAGVTVGAGEPEVEVTGPGSGGRNTHAALIAARRIEGTDTVFAALASDGVDGSSGSAGAIVDGETTTRGGDPTRAIARCDSAGYLAATFSLVDGGPTGTNVSDLWVVWRR